MKEEDIRPRHLFKKYLSLAVSDCNYLFTHFDFIERNCPVCGQEGERHFTKHYFRYSHCGGCATLFASYLPVQDGFDWFYTHGESVKFWASDFYEKTKESRRNSIWKAKVDLVTEKVGLSQELGAVVDIGAGAGLFLGEIKERFPQCQTIAIEPGAQFKKDLDGSADSVIQKFFEQMCVSEVQRDSRILFTSFELIEHLADLRGFVGKAFELMKTGDIFCATTLSSTGFDLVLLGRESDSIFPPHHITFINPDSLTQILKEAGFRNIEILTPGKLDVDIIVSRFLEKISSVTHQQTSVLPLQAVDSFQGWISQNNLSSHLMVICRR